MAKQAKPYREGAGWAMRQRVMGQDLYVSGRATSAAAKKEMDKRVAALVQCGKPRGLGPYKTTVAQALQDYGMERLPFQKGAVQEANRINKFLRAVGLSTIAVSACKGRVSADVGTEQVPVVDKKGKGKHFDVRLEPATAERKMARGLSTHRARQAAATQKSDDLRARLAGTAVSEVTKHQVQQLMDALREEGSEPSTLQLERAVIRRLFNYAAGVWYWSAPATNPAVNLVLPPVNNERDRVMSADEEKRLDEAVQDCRNVLVGPTLTLLTETAMRSSEPLQQARWGDVDWERKLLRLQDSKNDKRDVPLSPKAIAALEELRRLNPGEAQDPIVRITYEALKAAWGRACERAGIDNLHLHDLRHTSATRMALKTGNVFLVQALTGHKTLSQVARYVNVKAADVVALMHAEPSAVTKTVAAPAASVAPAANGPRLPARWKPAWTQRKGLRGG